MHTLKIIASLAIDYNSEKNQPTPVHIHFDWFIDLKKNHCVPGELKKRNVLNILVSGKNMERD